jgi:hypothetical protein
MLGGDKEEVFSLFKFKIDYARIVISADGAFSQGACESATRERGPRDGANAKVLGMGKAGEEGKKEKMRNDCGRAAPMEVMEVISLTLSVGIISRSSSRYTRL